MLEIIVHTLRTAAFLASVMALLHVAGYLEGLDALVLKGVSHIVPDQPVDAKGQKAPALVFTIQEQLFETKFNSRTPIDRTAFLELLGKIVCAYPSVAVLAIDYDLSPNGDDTHGQEQLNTFLLSLNAEFVCSCDARGDELSHDKENKKHVILINHFPAKTEEREKVKADWKIKMEDGGILFADGNLWYHGLVGAVLKYQNRGETLAALACIKADQARKARANTEPERAGAKNAPQCPPSFDGEPKLINFRKATANVRECPLEVEASLAWCKEHLKEMKPDVIFIGGRYAGRDEYTTPAGEKPGVMLHAYIYHSMRDPLNEKLWQAWLGEIVIGALIGLAFHVIWMRFHAKKPDEVAARAVLAALNIGLFIAIAILIILPMPWLIKSGWWINPGPILIGLFIDSHVAAAISACHQAPPQARHEANHGRRANCWRWLGKALLGLDAPVVNRRNWQAMKQLKFNQDFVAHVMLKFVIFWLVFAFAAGAVFSHH
jgi:CHASE2 domain-containing sensor protein